MSKFTHSLCIKCYQELEPSRTPVRMGEILNIDNPGLTSPLEICCKCGKSHASGIYYRAEPTFLLCKGIHEKELG